MLGSATASGTASLFAPSLAVRALARLRHLGLDRALRDGADPSASLVLAARARQLSSASSRAALAGALEIMASSADGPRRRSQVLPPRSVARANRECLLELAAILRRAGPVYVRGVAILQAALGDGTASAQTMGQELNRARAALIS
jgi:hypothetical protein